MYAGRIVESGPSRQVLGAPGMPYTAALLGSTPRVDAPARRRLVAISGRPPDLRRRPPGCAFAPRCPFAVDECRTEVPARVPLEPGHDAACLRTGEVDLRRFRDSADVRRTVHLGGDGSAAEATSSSGAEPVAEPVADSVADPAVPLAEFDDVRLHYPVRSGLLRRTTDHVRAVDGVSLRLWPGRTLALVGESGSGKTSLTRTLLRLEQPTGGTVRYDGIDVTAPDRTQLSRLQREVQVVFQNPYASLDPRMTVRQILSEPLRVHAVPAVDDVLVGLLDSVGLDRSALALLPRAFSGGQRQRIAIARALALKPRLIVCDEAVSALDVSIQAQVLNLLADLQEATGVAYLFITHDLAVVRSVAHRVAVMRGGVVVEQGDAEQIYRDPAHEYTKALLAMAPRDPRDERTTA